MSQKTDDWHRGVDQLKAMRSGKNWLTKDQLDALLAGPTTSTQSTYSPTQTTKEIIRIHEDAINDLAKDNDLLRIEIEELRSMVMDLTNMLGEAIGDGHD